MQGAEDSIMLLQSRVAGKEFCEGFPFLVQIAQTEYQCYWIRRGNDGCVLQKGCGYAQHCGELEQGVVTDARIRSACRIR